MSDERTFVIAGAGLAGAKAAETLRTEGFTGRVVLLGEEKHPPYERPPLSKGYLLGTQERETAFVHQPAWYDTQRIELRPGCRVEDVDTASQDVIVGGGHRLRYDELLLATGAVPRPLDVPGADLAGVTYLRTIDDSDALSATLVPGTRVVVIGAGWIGLEVTAAARLRGCAVTLVERDDQPLRQVLGDEMGAVFADLHRAHGVDLRLGSGVREIVGGRGRVSGVALSSGETVPADAVVVGIGVIPSVELAERAGLMIDNGVLVDSRLRTSDPHIYAVGDIANIDHPTIGRRVRVEHWATALHTGPAAARAMLGQDVVYDRLPYFFTDQYDLGMEYTGHAQPGDYDKVVVRGDLDTREFIAFWLSDGRVRAGMNVNVWDVTEDVQRLIRSGTAVDPGRLADERVPLAEV
ncbi:NAD(P)/FAD-dependent oxidoreductase [Pseudonocardia alaniniphila]|uniref:FAD-dependent oxidoreductase n=1 Tax=Pseudonocardia alaniniphila TaxID=75291 RepID=A0ABS9TTX7_9PSEU|nr:FAD-dependent oxidoreductase [Pseudonocardia alaniniphila]MCH6171946.1 FAD-dependent oxidoreductase [Pseudonocardia alaniniphila]